MLKAPPLIYRESYISGLWCQISGFNTSPDRGAKKICSTRNKWLNMFETVIFPIYVLKYTSFYLSLFVPRLVYDVIGQDNLLSPQYIRNIPFSNILRHLFLVEHIFFAPLSGLLLKPETWHHSPDIYDSRYIRGGAFSIRPVLFL